MSLSKKSPPYIIPEYSLTGDLLAYLTCPLQYRYQNKGSLPPSKPVQLWFGEFIHGVLEEAYRRWQHDDQRKFPWDWNTIIRDIELEVARRLEARGLYAPGKLFCSYGINPDRNCSCHLVDMDPIHEHQLIASMRSEYAINTWSPHLFPLIEEAEVRLKGIRDMPNFDPENPEASRCNYYGITGVADVISSVSLQNAPSGDLILHYLDQNADLQRIIEENTDDEYEIIIDYKGMRRQPIDHPTNDRWQHHEWQILTYGLLRSLQPEANKVVAGIIFYLNELAPSQGDMKELKNDIENRRTDIMPRGRDLKRILDWEENTPPPQLSRTFKERRSIRVVPVTPSNMQDATQRFDQVVNEIESCVKAEIEGRGIKDSWDPSPVERNCTACVFKTHCRGPSQIGLNYIPSVP